MEGYLTTETDWEKGNNVVSKIFSGQTSRNKAKGRMRWEGSRGDRAKEMVGTQSDISLIVVG